MVLHVAGYRFPDLTDSGPSDWDANWLVVAGQVRAGDSEWAFRDPCLTTWEARDLASWLRSIADNQIEPRPVGESGDGDGLLVFTEPYVALSYQQRLPAAAVIRVFLSGAASPSSANDQGLSEYFVEMAVPHESVVSAADDWDAELRAFPVRA